MEKILQLKRKENNPFISETGSTHTDAVLVVSNITNHIIDKQLQVGFLVFNSINDLDKKPIDAGFVLFFDQIDTSKTIVNPDTGEVIKWGNPSYNEVLELFNIVNDGIMLTSNQVEVRLLNSVKFKNEILAESWELLK